ncbi:hypothetical protein H5410_022009, partial [Solanum commersonii]
FLDDTTKKAKDIETLKVIEKRIRDVIYKAGDKVDSSIRIIVLADIEKNQKFLKVEKDVDSLGKELPQIEFNRHGRKSVEQVLTKKKNTN